MAKPKANKKLDKMQNADALPVNSKGKKESKNYATIPLLDELVAARERMKEFETKMTDVLLAVPSTMKHEDRNVVKGVIENKIHENHQLIIKIQACGEKVDTGRIDTLNKSKSQLQSSNANLSTMNNLKRLREMATAIDALSEKINKSVSDAVDEANATVENFEMELNQIKETTRQSGLEKAKFAQMLKNLNDENFLLQAQLIKANKVSGTSGKKVGGKLRRPKSCTDLSDDSRVIVMQAVFNDADGTDIKLVRMILKKIADVEVEKVQRMGESNTAPIKVTLGSQDEAKQILGNKAKLDDTIFKNVQIMKFRRKK